MGQNSIKFVTSTDEHIADGPNPGFCKGSYRDDLLQMLDWQGSLLRKLNATAMIRAGDLFHHKAANRCHMRTLSSILKIHSEYGCDTLAVAGNHDMNHNNSESIPGQPLGVLFESGMIHRLSEKTFEFGTTKVRTVGVEYTPDLDVDGLHNLVRKKDENYTVAIVHALAAMAPEEKIQSFFNERVFDYRDLVFDGCPDVYVFGHYHKDQGIVEHNGVKFVNVGALSRGALTLENLERKPKVSLIEINSNGVSVEEIIVPHKDASEVFDLDKKKRIDIQMKDMKDFLQKLESNSSINSSKTLEERLKNLGNISFDLRSMVLDTIEAVEAGLGEK